MRNVNKIILLGRLGNNPTLRTTKTGVSVAHFSMATSRSVRSPEAPETEPAVEHTQWHNIVVWGKQGEHCAAYLKKGEPVYIEGNVRTRQYEAKDGTKKYSFEVHADDICFLGGRPKTPAETVEAVAV